MTEKDFIVNCIQHMDIESLDLVFNANQVLQGTTKEIFLKKLNTVFAVFKKSGDTELIPYNGASLYKGRLQKVSLRFHPNVSNLV